MRNKAILLLAFSAIVVAACQSSGTDASGEPPDASTSSRPSTSSPATESVEAGGPASADNSVLEADGGCLAIDEAGQLQRYASPPFSGPNPSPDDPFWKAELDEFFGQIPEYYYDYSSLEPGAIAWLAAYQCRTGNWVAQTFYGSLGGGESYNSLNPSMIGAVMFCGMADKEGLQFPMAGRNVDNRDIASNVCPDVLD